MFTTVFHMVRDDAGYNGFGLVPSTVINRGLLVTDDAASVVAPTDFKKYMAIFSYTPGANVFVDFTTTATSPTAESESATAELLPQGREVESGATISLITPDTNGAYYSISFYGLE